jgi:hypothetical protein
MQVSDFYYYEESGKIADKLKIIEKNALKRTPDYIQPRLSTRIGGKERLYFFAGIFITMGAVLHAFLSRTPSYFALSASREKSTPFCTASVAIGDFLLFQFNTVMGLAYPGDLRPHLVFLFFILFLARPIQRAALTDQAAIGQ